MKILFLAPQPFFQERGTPIAVRLAVKVLAARKDDRVHLLTYHEGSNAQIPHTTHQRISAPSFLSHVGPGLSWKKLLLDVIFFFSVLKLLWNNRHDQFDLIHAVEESVFISLFLKPFFGVPYIYDMDSSLSLQMVEKLPFLSPLRGLFEFMERRAVKGSMAVVPVCDALAVIADRHGSQDTHILRDISLLDMEGDQSTELDLPSNLRQELSLKDDDVTALYIGNLESYQGIDLLLYSFAHIAQTVPHAHVIIIGGIEKHIASYAALAKSLGVTERVHFTGPRPVSHLNHYLMQADILLSPRTLGNNTPMKIYSYLHSGKPIVATKLPTHTQVLDVNVAQLADARKDAFGEALRELFESKQKREEIGARGRALAEQKYTFDVFQQRLNDLYDRVGEKVEPHHSEDLSQTTRVISK